MVLVAAHLARVIAVICLVAVMVDRASAKDAAGQPPDPAAVPFDATTRGGRAALESAWQKAFAEGKYADAEVSLRRLIERDPHDSLHHYNLACVLCRMERAEAAEGALRRALELGFVDFARLLSDKDLALIAQSDVIGAVRHDRGAGAAALQEARVEAQLARFRKLLTVGKQTPEQRGYVFEKDTQLRLAYVSGFSRDGLTETKQELRRIASFWERFVLPPMPDGSPRPSTVVEGGEGGVPDGWVVVFLPNGPDYQSWAQTTLGTRADRVARVYDHWKQQLVARDMGPTLRHEFCHALHWRSMSRGGVSGGGGKGQHHPVWIQEGLCALVEDVDLIPERDGMPERVVPVASWRTNTAKRMLNTNLLPRLPVLMAMDDTAFMGGRVLGHYAAGRAFFLWLSQQTGADGSSGGKLRDWYGAYTTGFETDRTGVKATERIFDKPLTEIDKMFRAWLKDLPDVGEANQPGLPTLPADLQPVGGEGMVVIDTGTRDLLKNPLLPGDVLVALDGVPVRDQTELARLLGGWGGRNFKHGQPVTLKVRRDGRTLELKVRLNE